MTSTNDNTGTSTNDNTSTSDDDGARLRRLTEEIKALQALAMTRPDDEAFWAQKLKLAADKIKEAELLIEEVRVNNVRYDYQEERRLTYKAVEEDCPICLKTMHNEEIDHAPHFACCGKFMCDKCKSLNMIGKCPLCPAEFPKTEREIIIALQKLAENGNAWAQYSLARRYEVGNEGVEVNDALALQWYHRSAEQGSSFAMLQLANWHLNRSDFAEARRWCQATIEKGHLCHAITAMEHLGQLKYKGDGGQQDQKEAVRLFTLNAAYSPEPLVASFYLGVCFYVGGGELRKSFGVAKYYLEKAVKDVDASNAGFAHFFLGRTLHDLTRERYRGRVDIPGHSSVPETLHWARKAVAMGYGEGATFIEQLEKDMKSSCANCTRNANELTDSLKTCTRCRAVCYCGKDCQVAHWKRGHKIDCFKAE